MKKYLILAVALLAASCHETSTDPTDGVDEANLTFLRFSSSAALATREGSFWAVKGQARRLELNYADGKRFLRFDVNGNSLLSAPNGRLYQNGDSVLITFSIDPAKMVIRFEPSGLKFNPVNPARLDINFEKKDEDIDGDGDIDGRDHDLELKVTVWKQERPGQRWFRQSTFRIDEDDIEAQILSFTGFAMAS